MKGRGLPQGCGELHVNSEQAGAEAPWYHVSEVLVT